MNCERARPLVPLYLDDALTEAQASALRPHLLECSSCRNVVQEEKALKAWFVPTEAIPVPEGFAARIARRAMAGDTGESYEESTTAASSDRHGGLYHFVVQAVAIAALLLVTLSIAIRRLELPSDSDLQATSPVFKKSLLELDRLNRKEELERARAEAVDRSESARDESREGDEQ